MRCLRTAGGASAMKGSARRVPLGLISVAVAVPLLAACGSSGGGTPAQASAGLCQQIGGVLSDGPDPGSDPVGYALSQIMPLGQITTSDTSVAGTITRLIAADKALVHANGKDHAATGAITKATAALNTACPGVAS